MTSPFLSGLLERARLRALRLYSESVTLEHLVGAALEDEDCAAVAAITFAFADPQTLEQEVAALTEGLMVVGSRGVMPFSPGAAEALAAARSAAGDEVSLETLLACALRRIEPSALVLLRELGLSLPEEECFQGPTLRLSIEARQALSLASRAALRTDSSEITPAGMALALLEQAPGRSALGLRHSAAREALRPFMNDGRPPADRAVPLAPSLATLLRGLAPHADSLDILLLALRSGSTELRAAFARQKVSEALLERARDTWRDQG